MPDGICEAPTVMIKKQIPMANRLNADFIGGVGSSLRFDSHVYNLAKGKAKRTKYRLSDDKSQEAGI